jgi:hypothetical protein
MTETEPRWKFHARNLIFLLVIASALPLALAAYSDIQAHKAGVDKPTIAKPMENVQHGVKKYVSAAEYHQIRLMWILFFICFPSSIVFAAVMRFGFGVHIFRKEPIPKLVDKLMNDLRKETQ